MFLARGVGLVICSVPGFDEEAVMVVGVVGGVAFFSVRREEVVVVFWREGGAFGMLWA